MKTWRLTIMGVSVAISVYIFWFFASLYDFNIYSQDNPLGIKAQVVYDCNHYLMMSFISCNQSKTFQLNFTSKEGSELLAYNICDGIFCTKKEGFDNRVINAHAPHPAIAFGQITGYEAGPLILGDLPWKTGDTVDIKIKVMPVTMLDNGSLIRYPEKTVLVDLGQSKIIDLGEQTK